MGETKWRCKMTPIKLKYDDLQEKLFSILARATLKIIQNSACKGIKTKYLWNMKNIANTITVSNIKNANELVGFMPVEGQWSVDGTSDERDYNEIVEAIEAHFAGQFPVKVELFQSNGHAINDDLPACGSFLATRK